MQYWVDYHIDTSVERLIYALYLFVSPFFIGSQSKLLCLHGLTYSVGQARSAEMITVVVLLVLEWLIWFLYHMPCKI